MEKIDIEQRNTGNGGWITPNTLFADTYRIYDVSTECLEIIIPLMCKMFPLYYGRIEQLLINISEHPTYTNLSDPVIERTALLWYILNRYKDGKI